MTRFAGDYPNLGVLTFDHKDPYEAWSDVHHRRNWGELVCFCGSLVIIFFFF